MNYYSFPFVVLSGLILIAMFIAPFFGVTSDFGIFIYSSVGFLIMAIIVGVNSRMNFKSLYQICFCSFVGVFMIGVILYIINQEIPGLHLDRNILVYATWTSIFFMVNGITALIIKEFHPAQGSCC